MKIAVEGCCHGELDAIYSEIGRLEKINGYSVDLLLICGDFQAMRNPVDLEYMACPIKYRSLGEFYKYYTREKNAPILTIVIGGNHEASNYMWELYHGGWLAPNIYYLGAAGSVKVNGLRISGASGIFNPAHYTAGHYERFPYNPSHTRSIYHTRLYEIQKLMFLDTPDIFLSHDWPLSIENHGDVEDLLRRKPFFKADIMNNALGSPPLLDVLRTLRPARWFSAHLHVRYEATYRHDSEVDEPDGIQVNPDEIVLSDDEDDFGANVGGSADAQVTVANPDEIVMNEEDESASTNHLADESVDVVGGGLRSRVVAANPGEITMDEDDNAEEMARPVLAAVESSMPQSKVSSKDASVMPRSSNPSATQFLALDKCLPRRRFLEVVDIPVPVPFTRVERPLLTFDPVWLGITRAFFPYLSLEHVQPRLPPLTVLKEEVDKHVKWVRDNLPDGGEGKVLDVQRFKPTAPGGREKSKGGHQWFTNPQTEAFCEMLQLKNLINAPPDPVALEPVVPGTGKNM